MTWEVDKHKYQQQGNTILVDGRKAGWLTKISNKTVFISPRDRAKHYFRIFEGWGISQALFTYLLKTVNVQEIHLRIGMMETLVSKMEDWEKHCIPYHKPPFEPQIILPEKYFSKLHLTIGELMENPKERI